MATALNTVKSKTNFDKVVAVRGSVVDIRFDSELTFIGTLKHIVADNTIAIEVLARFDLPNFTPYHCPYRISFASNRGEP